MCRLLKISSESIFSLDKCYQGQVKFTNTSMFDINLDEENKDFCLIRQSVTASARHLKINNFLSCGSVTTTHDSMTSRHFLTACNDACFWIHSRVSQFPQYFLFLGHKYSLDRMIIYCSAAEARLGGEDYIDEEKGLFL